MSVGSIQQLAGSKMIPDMGLWFPLQAKYHSSFGQVQTLYIYPIEPAEMPLLCLKLMQLPKSHKSSHPNLCQEALNQGRIYYTWYYDSILDCLVSGVKDEVPPSLKLYADIPSWRGSCYPPATLPSNISTSTATPDSVLILLSPF